MAEHRRIRPTPKAVPIPQYLLDFLQEIHYLANGLDKGTYKLREPYYEVCSGDITWSRRSGIFCRGIVGFTNEERSEFDFSYSHTGDAVWEFELSRQTLAEIDAGTVTELMLYGCENPVCGYKSSAEYERCPRCHLELGAGITSDHTEKILGLCPFCKGLLRTLYAQQCNHCLMDWHDPEKPVRMGSAKGE